MLGYVYLILSLAMGFVIVSFVFPDLKEFTSITYKEDELKLSPAFLLIPAWFITGILVMSWASYILACFFSKSSMPLLYADEAVMISSVPLIIGGCFWLFKDGQKYLRDNDYKIETKEKILFISLAVLFTFLMYMTLRVAHGQLYVGLTVFSDFTPHLSMIRSFSYGQNFPTQYSVCAGDDVRYHFMFEFLAGNLEFLGMRIDHAFNIPSILGVMSMYSFLYVFACKLTGSKIAGIISCVLLTFRSSSSLFYYISDIDSNESVIATLKNNLDFIGYTNNENWGLWNLNVYCNQRHFAFGLSVLLFIVIMFLPQVYEAFDAINRDGRGFKSFFKASLFNRNGWLPENILAAVCSGFILGMLGFFNGAVLIGTILVLFFLAVVAHRRLEYLIMAVVAGILSVIQTKVFINGSTFSTQFRYGFLADNPTLFGSIEYVMKLLGVLPLMLLLYFIFAESIQKYLMFAFSVPFIFAFNISLTRDIAVNHKYIMISVMLLNIFAALFLVMMFKDQKLLIRFLAGVLVICLTSTGIYDFYVIYKRNNPKYAMVNNLDDPLLVWIADNCDADDLFLTSNYYITNSSSGSSVILSGAMMYNAWQYFGWSAGYDTEERDRIVSEIYGCTDPDRLKDTVNEIGFSYIVIDYSNRVSDYYDLNEQIFEDTYDVAYTQGEGSTKVTIYKVSQ